MRRKRIAAFAVSTLAALTLAGPASALADPVLEISSSHVPAAAGVPQGTYAKYTVSVSNVGTSQTTEPVKVDFTVPAGLEVTAVTDEVNEEFSIPLWGCTIAPGGESVSCDGPEAEGEQFPIEPGEEACEGTVGLTCRLLVTVRASSNASLGTVHPSIAACIGDAVACVTAPDDPFEIVPFEFYLTRFDGQNLQENGDPATQAASYPFTASSGFTVSTYIHASGHDLPSDELKDAIVKLPPGLIGNPQAYPTCTQQQLVPGSASESQCPSESQVGIVDIGLNGAFTGHSIVGVFNMEVPAGLPALFAFNYSGKATEIYAKVRSGEDYGVTLAAVNAPQTLPIGSVDFTFWGIPADASHDAQRFCSTGNGPGCESADSADPKPFVSLPTSCLGSGPNNSMEFSIDATGWLGSKTSSSFLTHDNTEPIPNPIGITGCNAVDFSPTLEARPTTNVADAPSGLDVDLHIPQAQECDIGPPVSCENAQAHLKDTTVTLPEGLVINPSSANGLGACSLAQFGFTNREGDTIHTTPDPATCPDSSKLGTVQIDTPLLADPLKGAVYLAEPYANPFNSLIAIYIAVDDKKTGLVVKLAGEVKADPRTGRLTTTVLTSPQLPFEDFKLHFFAGAGASLRTPAVCGFYSTTSSLTPWTAPDSGPPATPSDTWAIQTASGGGICPTSEGALPHRPDLDAGSVSPVAASYTPTVINLRRGDGTQEFSTISLTLPPGLTGKLRGIEQCSEAALATAASKPGNEEKSNPSCPSNSRIGTVDVAAGAGPAPYNAKGIAYLAGPYKGASLSLAVIVPATAGPFDLGTVVERDALYLDRNSARITGVSDSIPTILQGIPLDVRSVSVKLDRPDFTRNGTSCNPSSFEGSLVSTLSQSAPLSERFQLGECAGLAFKPKLAIRLFGGTKRGAHPALRATLQMPQGGANIAKASVALPHSEFLDQGHIGTVCTRVQFAAKECPAASIYGSVKATSPMVDYTLEGPAYLRSSDNELPDLVMALHGPPSQPVEVDAVGRIDSVKGGIRTTFEGTPDIAVSSLVLNMAGGKKGLLQNSTNICKGKHKATAEFDGHNGKVSDFKVLLKNGKCGKARKRKTARRN